MVRRAMACSLVSPHISKDGLNERQTAGRSGSPESLQCPSAVSWTHLTAAGLPASMPGIGDEIEGAMQQAAQPTLQSIFNVIIPGS